jgi:hypothetical protein
LNPSERYSPGRKAFSSSVGGGPGLLPRRRHHAQRIGSSPTAKLQPIFCVFSLFLVCDAKIHREFIGCLQYGLTRAHPCAARKAKESSSDKAVHRQTSPWRWRCSSCCGGSTLRGLAGFRGRGSGRCRGCRPVLRRPWHRQNLRPPERVERCILSTQQEAGLKPPFPHPTIKEEGVSL